MAFKIGEWDVNNKAKETCEAFVKSSKNINKLRIPKTRNKKKVTDSKISKVPVSTRRSEKTLNNAIKKSKNKSTPVKNPNLNDSKPRTQPTATVKKSNKQVKPNKNRNEKKSLNRAPNPALLSAQKKSNKKINKSDDGKTAVAAITAHYAHTDIARLDNPMRSSRHENQTKSLRDRMMERLKAAKFRYLNEEIYLQDDKHAAKLFKKDPDSFKDYHTGYRQQVAKWPMNPLDVIIKNIVKMPSTQVIADMGCGEAKLAQSVPQTVHSFDLVALNDDVTVANIASVPLDNESIDVAVFCLSLMGTNLHDYIREANRILKIGGLLKIAEVESRFDNVDTFAKGVQCFGFKKARVNLSNNLFYFLDFRKESKCKSQNKLPTISLKPCLYKKR